jgi:hypothetical protein
MPALSNRLATCAELPPRQLNNGLSLSPETELTILNHQYGFDVCETMLCSKRILEYLRIPQVFPLQTSSHFITNTKAYLLSFRVCSTWSRNVFPLAPIIYKLLCPDKKSRWRICLMQ